MQIISAKRGIWKLIDSAEVMDREKQGETIRRSGLVVMLIQSMWM